MMANKKSTFQPHIHYSREDIGKVIGGETQSYLPRRSTGDGSKGPIVCGCFSLEDNPDAPDIVLAGNSADIHQRAIDLCEQGGTIPVFVKDDDERRTYVGDYKVAYWSENPKVIAQQHKLSGRDNVARVLFLEAVN